MKIDKIILNNIGPYEGVVKFDTTTDSKKNIIIIGGKNGAGKTTLFTAMRLCLYGHMSFGYKNQNATYTKAVKRLINNNAKKEQNTYASVSLQMRIHNNREMDFYEIQRSWATTGALQEHFIVARNGDALNESEIADFEKYLLSLIPPELFNLYFFDGERIADFFLDDGGNTRIKSAFLTLCGYDTFDIMQRNFKRVKNNTKGNYDSTVEQYLQTRERLAQAEKTLQEALTKYEQCHEMMENCSAELKTLEQSYKNSGGITQEEYIKKIETLKEEEKNREYWNALLKKWSNDIVPFIIIKDQLRQVQKQISNEKNEEKFEHFVEILNSDEIKSVLLQKYDSHIAEELPNMLEAYVGELNISHKDKILGLSFEQSVGLMAQIDNLLQFDNKKINKLKILIKKSIKQSDQIRDELTHCNIDSVELYMGRKTELLEEYNQLLQDEAVLQQEWGKAEQTFQIANDELIRAKRMLEEELKKESVQDISIKAILMLDELQEVLYQQQIEKVEQNFCVIINKLMRKTQFIDDIKIDKEFNIKIYRNEQYQVDDLKKLLREKTKEQMIQLLGSRAWNELDKNVREGFTQPIILPVELDLNTLSNGEKQVFIMALYQSLICLSKHEIPFVIDTPFARIDTEHRENISEHFFSKLNGQIFILSTNEEINEKHMQILDDKINRTFILENTDNKQTHVTMNKYFEVSL